MKFSIFLQHRQDVHKLKSIKDHFQQLGGEKSLEISLRHFQQITLGTKKPSVDLFERIFIHLNPDERHTAVFSFFESTIDKEKNIILEFLKSNLIPDNYINSNNPWNRKDYKEIFFNLDQMDFLSKNKNALRLHQRAIMYDFVEKDKCRLSNDILSKMEKLKLITIKENKIFSFNQLYKIPKFQNSPKLEASKGHELIISFIDEFFDKTGTKEQNIGLKMQFVSKESTSLIEQQLVSLNKWIQSLAESDHINKKELQPFILITMARLMTERDLW